MVYFKMNYEQKVFYTIALFGGFLCGYSVLSRLDVLGSAQTSNLISLVFAISGQNLTEVLIRIGALFLYISAIVAENNLCLPLRKKSFLY